jgi:hypothetical protein
LPVTISADCRSPSTTCSPLLRFCHHCRCCLLVWRTGFLLFYHGSTASWIHGLLVLHFKCLFVLNH